MILMLVALVAVGGSFIQSVSGFGFAIVCMSLWPLLLPFQTAAAMEAISAFVMVTYLSIRLRHHIQWKILWPPAIIAISFSILGVHTLSALSEHALHRILGIALLLLDIYFIFFSGKFSIKPGLLSSAIAGAVSGFLSGLFNIGGPPMAAYFLAVCDQKETYEATLETYFLLTSASVFLSHLFIDDVTQGFILPMLAAIAGTVLGTICGYRLFQHITLRHIKKLIYAFMLIAGMTLIIFG